MTHKRKKAKKARQRSRTGTQTNGGIGLYAIPSPFEGMEESEVTAAFIAMGNGFHEQYDQAIRDIETRVLAADPLQMLAMFSFYVLTTGLGGKRSKSIPQKVGQPDGEFLQALVLKHALRDFSLDPLRPDAFQPILDAVHAASQGFALRRLSQVEVDMPIEQRAAVAVKEGIRLHTQGIRNWGYPKQTYRLMTELFATVDDEIERKIGVRVQHLATMGMNAIDLIENRVNDHLAKLQPMLRAKSVPQVVQAYHKSFTDLKGCPGDTIRIAKEQGWTAEMTRVVLLSHSDLRLPELYTLSLDDFVNLYPAEVDKGVIQSVLRRWSLGYGDLAEHDTEHFFMGNPIWTRPIIHLGEGLYFWPLVGLFLSFGVEMMEELIAGLELQSRYEKRRASLLEQEIARLFREAFPNAKTYLGSQWYDPITGKTYENDLLVALDSHLLVVEAKSAGVAKSALRGGEARLKHVVEELMVSPSHQSQRFADYLDANRGLHEFPTKAGTKNVVDTSRVTRIVRLSVTLERIGDLIAQSRTLQRAGLIPLDTNPAPTIALPDIEIIFTILDSDCRKLHYLTRRAEIEKHASYQGDESDLLAFYLQTGFNIGEAEFDDTGFFIYGMGEVFDSYFLQAEYGIDTPMPKPRITNWWQDILSRVESLNAARWSELGCMLLNVSYEDQQKFETKIREVKKKMLCGSNAIDTVILASGSPQRRDLFLGLCYHRMTREHRNQRIRDVAGGVMEEQGFDKAVVIGIQVEDTGYPYDVLVLSTPAKTEPGHSEE